MRAFGVCTPPPPPSVMQRGLGAPSENPWGHGPTQNLQNGAVRLGSCTLSKAPSSAPPHSGPLCSPALHPSPKASCVHMGAAPSATPTGLQTSLP